MEEKDIAFEIRKSRRAKKVRLSVYVSGRVVLTVPVRYSESSAKKFAASQSDWIQRKLEALAGRQRPVPLGEGKSYAQSKKYAAALVKKKLLQWNAFYGFKYGRVSIRNQKSRWGSCSRKGNLNFNYKIVFLPEEIQDYLIVHELCHLKYLNHSEKFWQEVARAVPNYKSARKALRGLI